MGAGKTGDSGRTSGRAGQRRRGWLAWSGAAVLGVGVATAISLSTTTATVSTEATSYQLALAPSGTAAATTVSGKSGSSSPQAPAGGAQTTVANAPLVVVGLGDSVPSGAACGCTSFIATAGRSIAEAQHRSLTVSNLAVGGFTSSDVLAQLDSDTVQRQIAAADVVIIEIGANDFEDDQAYEQACRDEGAATCYAGTLRSTAQRVSSIVTTVRNLQTKPTAAVYLLGYWNVFRDGAAGQADGATYMNASDALTRAFNIRMTNVAAAAGVTYVDVYRPFKGGGDQDATRYLADDGEHPNAAGHALLSAAVVKAATAVV